MDCLNWRRQRGEVKCGGAMFIEEIHIAGRILAEYGIRSFFKNEAEDFNFIPVYVN